MTEWKMRRFWKSAGVIEDKGGFGVALDDKPLRTPAKAALILPTPALARAVADEWQAQGETVDPTAMPFTRSANSAIDKVAPQRDGVIAALTEYGGTDLLCYRATGPQALIDAQEAAWDPMLDWAARTFDARLEITQGVMPVTQDAGALDRLAAPLTTLSPFELVAVHDLIALSGSLVLGLAVAHGGFDAAEIWSVSRVDEDWQAEEWGADEEAVEMAVRKRADFLFAHEFLMLSRAGD